MSEPAEFLTIAEFCAKVRVDRKTVYRRMKRKRLAGATHLGRVVRIHWPTYLRSLESK